ncbi:hypothetical protein DL240_00225 [Lujinxingia litoralis]|uniref:Peptidase M20 dimerisation domain-containing protein n=1 Tax=Lujinxingia litoralis TaxID=2211119 RepID=A0A328CAW4_9DELT|nr:M20/M25/M40 family metallo-hydrolase [Lujinxingia litoralis]RAL24670.1 hypothetical protein DL240_00225 [Lujinxingia litoralis]
MNITLRRAFLSLGGSLLVLVSVVLVRTAMLTPAPSQVSQPEIELSDEDAIIARFARALSIPTVSPTAEAPNLHHFRELHDHLQSWFPRVHAEASLEVVNDATLFFTLPGTDPALPEVVFLAHQDVVPVEPGTEHDWTYPPFGGTVAEGFVWGRGALDNKHNLMALMEALERQLQQGERPRHTLSLVFGHDEEVGGTQGAKVVASLLKEQGASLAAVYDEGLIIADGLVPGIPGQVALIGITEKGYVTLNLTATAEGGHASMPPEQLAVSRLAAALNRLANNPMPAAIDGPTRMMFDALAPHMAFPFRALFANLWLTEPLVVSQMEASPASNAALRTTVAPTMLRASPRENVLPQQAVATLNIRINPRDSIADVLAYVESVIDDSAITVTPVGEMRSEPGPMASTERAGYIALRESVQEVFGAIPVAPNTLVAAADGRHFTDLTPDVYRFQAVALTARDLERIHSTDERLATGAYLDLVRFYGRLLQKW